MALNRRTLLTASMLGAGALIARSRRANAQESGAFTATIQITGEGPVDLRALADAAGFNGAQAANINFEIGPDVTLVGAAGAPDGGVAIDTGEWPSASHSIALALLVGGKVYGGGGKGAHGAGLDTFDAGAGGDAVVCREAIAITVASSGEVRAGGGGGGGGGGWSASVDDTSYTAMHGGGGGGGFPNGLPGSGAQSGLSGAPTGGGAGGGGGAMAASRTSGAGGQGGDAAAAGDIGVAASGSEADGFAKCNAGSGAQAGYAVRKNGHGVSITNNGVVSGAVS